MQGAAEARHSLQPRGRNREQYDAGLLGVVADVWLILMQAQAAAHLYAELNRQSDATLAGKGLRRADLTRAAYHALTRER